MKKLFFTFIFISVFFTAIPQVNTGTPATRTIFAYGGAFTKQFMRYVIALTKKQNPRICFLPTATGDNAATIVSWYEVCQDLPMQPYVQKTFIASYTEPKTFDENLLSMDAIIVSGGNTLNMLAIWKAQGIDTVLRKAYNKGIVLAGGSAGGLCWFDGGTTDSHPKDLAIIHGLAFIAASHCPHYDSEPMRKPLYLDNIIRGRLSAGYAIDDRAGVVFENEQYIRTVAIDYKSHAYYVSIVDGRIDEKVLPVERIIK